MRLTLDAPLDMHLHLREQEMLDLVAPFSAAQFAGVTFDESITGSIVSTSMSTLSRLSEGNSS